MTRALALPFVLISLLCSVEPLRVAAATPELDHGLGGFASRCNPDSPDFIASAVVVDAEGRVVLAGTLHKTFHVQRRSGPRFQTCEDVDIIIDDGQFAASAHALAIAPNGKIVVAGDLDMPHRPLDFAVARLKPDLTLDPTFAGDGTTSCDFEEQNDNARAVAVQPDGRIVIAGSAVTGAIACDDCNADFAIARFNANGTLDSTFNGNGKWTKNVQPIVEPLALPNELTSLVIQPDGKLVVGGCAQVGTFATNNQDFAIMRLNPDGSTDDGFGDDGLVTSDLGGHDEVAQLALDADGTIIAVGGEIGGYQDSVPALRIVRYAADGSLLRVFDRPPGVVNAGDVVVLPDGKLLVAAAGHGGVVLRFLPDGILDGTFGTNGETVVGNHGELALQQDGMFLAAGGAELLRFRWDGSRDTGGIMPIIFAPEHVSSEATALGVQANGQLLVAGKVFTTDYDMAVARYTTDRHGLDVTYGTDKPPPSGRTLYRFFNQGEEIRAAVVAPDDRLVVAGRLTTPAQEDNMLIGRFNTDGTADTSCAQKGFTDIDFGIAEDAANAVLVAGAKIYAAGTARGSNGNDYGLVRLRSDCTVDSTDAILPVPYRLRFDLGGDDSAAGVVLDAQQRPVLAGTSGNDIVLIRIRTNAKGMPEVDDGFGDHGRAVLSVGVKAVAVGLAQQADGKLIVGGWARVRKLVQFFENRLLVARFTADGQLDSGFGDGGVALAGTGHVASALAVRRDDAIALAGNATVGTDTLFSVAQFTPSGQLDTAFNGTGLVTLRVGPDGEDAAQALAFVGENHLAVGGYSLVHGIRQFTVVGLQTRAVDEVCAGDCNRDGTVAVSEVVLMVDIALGRAFTCDAADPNGDGEVTIDEILAAVRAALTSCSTA